MVLKARKTSNVIPVGCPAHNNPAMSGGSGGCPVMDHHNIMSNNNNNTNKSQLEQDKIDEKVADDMATIYSILILKVGVIIIVFIILWFMEDFEAPPGSPAYATLEKLEASSSSSGSVTATAGGMAAEHITTMGTVGGHS
eukprot:CAMPEP_0117029252 /NCGR_PEP_ID=MMETSP0472-20121206/21195_1 /TAXON_ID=693140 ORGANISM="Tiarina fusus, Strain LIS" /NCGR_SAMPLE_ID=MMETSP0472 /ASSEMBLY_ACC=CAM_ASM_000603 /LENGTH=139 /DNA_ID=CAMNT_0004736961 /DNA_START=122 /DNA_END=541 /DNA_ORIENTATION=+